ncbi:MAG: sugar phosphate isomerase/epimerase [Acidobacteria bacterium]|nr:sugar phosphate isomerase/epimerase [Acidobacteriota bacterium]
MKKAISTHLFRDAVLGVPQLDLIARAGFDLVEIFCARQHFDYTDANHVREIAGWFSDSVVQLHSLHAPLSRDPQGSSHHAVVSIAFTERQRRQDSMDEIKRVLEVAERAPYRYLITHIGVPGEEYDLRKFDAALTSLEHLRLFAGQRGVSILVENIPNDLSTARRLLDFIRHTHMPDLMVCFDSGHALLDGSVEDAFSLLKNSIASTHLHDNGGVNDDHRFPWEGKIEWEKTISDFHNSAPTVPLLLEVRRNGQEIAASLEKASGIFEKFERIIEESVRER